MLLIAISFIDRKLVELVFYIHGIAEVDEVRIGYFTNNNTLNPQKDEITFLNRYDWQHILPDESEYKFNHLI